MEVKVERLDFEIVRKYLLTRQEFSERGRDESYLILLKELVHL